MTSISFNFRFAALVALLYLLCASFSVVAEESYIPITITGYDLSLTKAETSSGPYAAGSTVTYSITVTNEGCIDANNIQVQDNPDSGLNYVGSDVSSNANVTEPVPMGFIISSIPQGTSETFNVTFTISNTYTGSIISNKAQILVDDGNDIDSDPMQDYFVDEDGDGNPLDDDESVVTVSVQATYDLALTKFTTTFGTIEPGDVVNFTILVTNQGQANANNIQVTDFPGSGFNYVGSNANTISNVTETSPGVFTITSLPAGQSQAISIQYMIDITYQNNTIINAAEITIDNGNDVDSTPNNGVPAEDDYASVTINVTITCTLTCTISSTDLTCYFSDDGTATAMPSGGTPPYSYQWDDFAGTTTQTVTNLLPTVYTVTVTDNDNCVTTCQVAINEPFELICSLMTFDASCGANDGSILVSASGGTGTIVYSLDGVNYQSSSTFSNLAAGSYTITVKDANDCESTCSGTISGASSISCTTSSTNETDCGAMDGSITVSGSGGNSPYTYSVDGSNFQSSNVFNGLSAGNYTVTIQDDDGCTSTCTASITSPSAPMCTTTGTQVTCFGANDGTITATGSGGTGSYQYSLNGGAFQSSGFFNNLGPGNYTITVRNTGSTTCTSTCTFNITEPPVFTCSVQKLSDVICHGQTNGSAIVNISGGSGPFSYSWSTGATSQTVNNFAAGFHSVTVTDSQNCETSCSITINQPTPLTCSTTVNSNACNGNNSGQITATGAGGTAPYTYSLNGGAFQAGFVFQNLGAGNYTITIKDNNDCTSTCTATVTNTAFSCTVTGMDVSCFNGTDGMVTAMPNGGNAPYTFQWDDSMSSNTQSISGLPVGTYSVTITEFGGCTSTCNYTITQPTQLGCTTSTTDVDCSGPNTGSLTVMVTGGTPGYIYSINGVNFQSSPTFNNLAAGMYTVTVRDSENCTITCTGTVGSAGSVSCTANAVDVSCFGGADGVVSVTGFGGQVPYSYSIDGVNFQTSNVFTGLPAAVYSVTIQDNQNCSSTCTTTVNSPPPLSCSTTTTDTNCGASDGTLTVTAVGGNGGFSYSIDGVNYQSSTVFTGLSAATYTVTVVDMDNCTTTCTGVVGSSSGLTCSLTITDTTCGASDGSITVAVSGGASPFSYSIDGVSFQTSPTFNNLGAGFYTIIVQDDNNCTTSCSGTVSSSTDVSCTTSTTDIGDCGMMNGTLTVNGTGGNSPYTYSLDGVNFQSSNTFSGLGAGTYTATIMDDDGCTSTCNGSISAPNAPTCSATSTPESCPGASDGTITAVGMGGSGSYQYSINGTNFQVSGTFTGLTAGNYTITIRLAGSQSCTSTCSATVGGATALVCNVTKLNDVLCNGESNGAASVSSSGGTSPYSYSWSNGSTSSIVNNLSLGTYIVTVTDANGCTNDCSVTISQPTVLSCSATGTDINCATGTLGSISVIGSGGTAPYLYSLNGGAQQAGNLFVNLGVGNYTVEIEDANGCVSTCSAMVSADNFSCSITGMDVTCAGAGDGMATVTPNGGIGPFSFSWNDPAGSSTQTVSNLVPGVYTVTVMDNVGCETACFVSILQPSVLSCNTATTNANNGNNGSITVAGNGGTPSYIYSIDGVNFQSNNVFNNLAPGTYSITIRDSNNCESSCIATVNGNGNITCNATGTNLTDCGLMDGTITATASGGSGTYGYSLDNLDFTNTSGVFTNLGAGNYTVYVVDTNGAMTTCNVTLTAPSAPGCTISGTPITCNGANDGTITIQGTGGSGSYEYSIDGVNYQTNGTFTNLGPGNYGVLVRIVGTQNCISVCNYNLTNPPTMGCAMLKNNDIMCAGEMNGSATVLVSGGVLPYSYAWSNGASTQTVNNLPQGNSSVTVTDDVGCMVVCSVNITAPSALLCSTSVTNGSCSTGSTGSITVTGNGGTPPYMYSLDGVNFQPGNMFVNVSSGSYTVTIKDDNDCLSTCSATITSSSNFSCNISSTDVTCNGGNNGMVTASPQGGSSPYTFDWSNGGNTQSLSNLTAGSYTVTITDNGGCEAVCSVTINQPLPVGCLLSKNNVSCDDGIDGSIMVTPSGGTPPYTYSIDGVNFQSSQVFSNLGAGTYTITIEDAFDCITTCSTTITEPLPVSCTVVTSDESTCGANDGSITATGSGGAGNYTYSIDGINYTSSGAFNGLSAGTYTILVLDANGCMSSCTGTISTPSAPGCTISGTPISCSGANDGTITTQGTGGSGNYEYSIDGVNFQTSGFFNNLGAGTYSVVVRNQGSTTCTSTCTYTLMDPNSLSCSLNLNNNVTCNGGSDGSASISITGGTPPFTFLWSDGSTSSSNSNLSAGIHSVTITDTNSCQTSCSITVTQPTNLTCSLSVDQGNCGTGSQATITVNATGGVPGYLYSLDNGPQQVGNTFSNVSTGNHIVTTEDANGCETTCSIEVMSTNFSCSATGTNVSCFGESDGTATATPIMGSSPYTYAWSNGQTNQTATNLTAGIYSVTITDGNNCMTTCNYTVLQPVELTCALAKTDVSCFGGSDGTISVAAGGGSGGYQYSLDGTVFQNSPSFTNLTFGSYTVTIQDSNGCSTTCSITIINGPTFSCNAVATDASGCGSNDGTITVTPSGGSGGYSFSLDGVNFTNSNGIFTGLNSGLYITYVQDSNGCVISCSATVSSGSSPSCTVSGSDPTCNGGADGSATITGTGGNGTYEYSIDGVNFQSSGFFDNLTAGSYTLTVRIPGNSSCSSTCSIVLNQPSDLMCMAQLNANVSCPGAGDGEATAVVSGGTPPYSYIWDNGATTANVMNLAGGTHSVTVTDSQSCQETCSVNIFEPGVINCSVSAMNVSCAGGSDGTLNVSAFGGNGFFTYSLDGVNFQSSSLFTGLSAGAYTITIKDAQDCTETCSETILDGSTLSCSAIATDESACGSNDGTITVTTPGGSSTFVYSLDGVNFTNTTGVFTGLGAGVYMIYGMDNNGCSSVCSATIIAGAAPMCSVSTSNVTCGGAMDGSIVVNGSGGSGNYEYSIDGVNFQTDNAFNNLDGGNYTVTIREQSNPSCFSVCSAIISEQSGITCQIQIDNDIDCFGDVDGSASVVVNGGISPFAYNWSNGVTTDQITGVASGTYSVTITDLAGCTAECAITFNAPSAMSCAVTATNESDCGTQDGSLNVSASGGTGNYSYSLDNVDYSNTSGVFTNLTAGTYTVFVQDDTGCQTTCSGVISSPNSPACSISGTAVTCNGDTNGSLTVTATGGTGSYEYSIDGTNYQSNASFTNLAAATYTVIVRNQGSTTCLSVCNYTVEEPEIIQCALVITNVTCSGENDGFISVNPIGGVSPYTYLWNTGATTASLQNQQAGAYSCTITDVNNCTQICDGTITEPTTLTCSIAAIDESDCGSGNGQIIVTATGGTPNYLYSIDGVTYQTNNTYIGLSAGNYTITVEDGNACQTTCSATISAPDTPACSLTTIDESCGGSDDGEIIVTATGGSGIYEYSLDDITYQGSNQFVGLGAGNYTVYVRNSGSTTCVSTCMGTIGSGGSTSNCNVLLNNDILCFGENNGSATANPNGGIAPFTYLWSNGNIWQTADNLPAGLNTVTITDDNGCQQVCSVTISEPIELTCIATATDLTDCGSDDGSIQITSSGGTGNRWYSLDNVDYTNTSGLFESLSEGTYTLYVKDENDCVSTCSATVTSPSVPTCTLVASPITCIDANDAVITVNAGGGSDNYEYSLDGGSFQSENFFENLGPGEYTVTVRNIGSLSCTSDCVITIVGPTELFCNATINNQVSCFGGADGSVSVEATGGVGPYTYDWNTGETTTSSDNLVAGDYSVTIIDDHGCEAICAFTISQPEDLVCVTSVIEIDCESLSPGIIIITANGGTGTYEYSIDGENFQGSNAFNNLASGDYTIITRDDLGCETLCSATIADSDCIYDLSLEKIELSSGPYIQGSTIIYGVEVTNDGDVDANLIQFEDIPSSGLNYIGSNASSIADVTEVSSMTFEISSLPVNASIMVELTFEVDQNFEGLSVMNQAQIIADDGDDVDSDPSQDETVDEDGNGLGDDDDEDALEIQLSVQSIGDFVWKDLNADGMQDSGEPGVEDVIVMLMDCDGNGIQMDTTDSNGNYSFENLPLGNYQIQFDLSLLDDACTFTIMNMDGDDILDSDANADGLTNCFQLNPTLTDIHDAGLIGLATVGSLVWIDANGNGIFDSGELPLGGVMVELMDTFDNVVDDMFTDGSGNYLFEDILPGPYYLRFTLPSGYDFTFPFSGSTALDSDVDGSNGTGTTPIFNLETGEQDLDWFAGAFECVTIGSLVWYDAQQNATYDATEDGINGVKVEFYRLWETDNNFELYDFVFTDYNPETDQNGFWKACVPPGTYYYKYIIDVPGYIPVEQNVGSNESIDSDMAIDGSTGEYVYLTGEEHCEYGAGYYHELRYGDRVWYDDNGDGIQDSDESGAPGVEVALYDNLSTFIDMTMSDADGFYQFDSLLAGDYYIHITPPTGYVPTIPNATIEGLDNDIDNTNGMNTSALFEGGAGDVLAMIDAGITTPEVLSATWLGVSVERQGDNNLLSWRVAQDVDVDYYRIERLVSNGAFIPIGQLLATGTSDEFTYSFVDYNCSEPGEYYYRIKAIGFDGTFEYSRIVQINVENQDKAQLVQLYPNPAINAFTITFDVEEQSSLVSINIYNESGALTQSIYKLEQQFNAGEHRVEVDSQDWMRGVYFVECMIGNKLFTEKLILLD